MEAHHLPVTGLAFKLNEGELATLLSSSADYSLFLLEGHGPNFKLRATLALSLVMFLKSILKYAVQQDKLL